MAENGEQLVYKYRPSRSKNSNLYTHTGQVTVRTDIARQRSTKQIRTRMLSMNSSSALAPYSTNIDNKHKCYWYVQTIPGNSTENTMYNYCTVNIHLKIMYQQFK